jgi:multidrug transporter EmrE-like cation transporter
MVVVKHIPQSDSRKNIRSFSFAPSKSGRLSALAPAVLLLFHLLARLVVFVSVTGLGLQLAETHFKRSDYDENSMHCICHRSKTLSAPSPVTALCLVGFIVGQTASGIWFKLAADRHGMSALGWFIAANVAGFLCAICLPLALRGQHPNIIYALCMGGGFCALQLVSALLFRCPLSLVQWLGVAMVGVGLLCLALGAPAPRS